MSKSIIMVNVPVPPGEHPFEGARPGKQPFGFPPSFVSPELSAILCFCFYPSAAMRCNHVNAFCFELLIQRIRVTGTIPNKAPGSSHGEGLTQGSFDKGDYTCGEAAAVWTASGRPAASATTRSFVPLPRLVFPTQCPLFSPPQRCRL